MSGEKFRLVMSSGPNPGKVFELNMDSMSIGREATNDIVIQDAELSRNHARISRRGATFLLEDLGSTTERLSTASGSPHRACSTPATMSGSGRT